MKSEITEIGVNKIDVNGIPIKERMLSTDFFGTILELNDLLLGITGYDNSFRKKLIELIAIGFVDHGVIPPSTMAARIAASCGSSVTNSYISAFSMFGVKHAPVESCFQYLIDAKRVGIDSAIKEYMPRVPGFGHPMHNSDPRVECLFSFARKGKFHEHQSIANETAVRIKHCVNYAGAVAAVCLDNKISPEYAVMLITSGRMIGLTAHIIEQRKSSKMILNNDQK